MKHLCKICQLKCHIFIKQYGWKWLKVWSWFSVFYYCRDTERISIYFTKTGISLSGLGEVNSIYSKWLKNKIKNSKCYWSAGRHTQGVTCFGWECVWKADRLFHRTLTGKEPWRILTTTNCPGVCLHSVWKSQLNGKLLELNVANSDKKKSTWSTNAENN